MCMKREMCLLSAMFGVLMDDGGNRADLLPVALGDGDVADEALPVRVERGARRVGRQLGPHLVAAARLAGEGGTWLEAGAQVLSFLGGASLFHTTDDIAAKATTPAAVELAATVAFDATRIFLDGSS